MPHLRRPGVRGDLHVLVDVKVPTHLTERQRELLEEFAAESGESADGDGRRRACHAPQGQAQPRRASRTRSAERRRTRCQERSGGRSRGARGRRPPVADEGTSAAGTWLELAVEADTEAVEAVREILSRVAPGGVTVEPPFATSRRAWRRPHRRRPAIVRAYLPAIDRAAAEAAIARARARLGHLRPSGCGPSGSCESRAVHEADWAEAWKQHFPVLRLGRRLVIRPPGGDDPAPDDVVVALDPGMAFGTGLHPTTRLCLVGVERWRTRACLTGASVVDVGCGSGILSVAAGLLGAAQLRGVDIDPIAVEATRRTPPQRGGHPRLGRLAARRPAGPSTWSSPTSSPACSWPGAGAGGCPAPRRRHARRGGRLLASGIFVDREPEVVAAFAAAGLRIVGRDQETDWVALDAGAEP